MSFLVEILCHFVNNILRKNVLSKIPLLNKKITKKKPKSNKNCHNFLEYEMVLKIF
jgi:hypothetical protein